MNSKLSLIRYLRYNMTGQERKLWQIIRKRAINNFRFRRQYPIGKYIVDFICREKKLIIEVDGGQHNTKENIQADKERTEYLESKGYKVLRFWNNEIDKNIEGVYSKILQVLEECL